MGLIQRIKTMIIATRPNLSVYGLVPQFGLSKATDDAALVDRFRSWVYRAAQMNAETCASVPLRLYVNGPTSVRQTRRLTAERKGYLADAFGKAMDGASEIIDHPMLDLIEAANVMQTGRHLMELTFLYQELLGNAYWYLERAQTGPTQGLPSAIWPLLAQYVRIVPDADGRVAGYLYGRNQIDRVALAAEDVIHFPVPNPKSLYYGMGPLQAALSAVDRSNSMADYEESFFRNNARVDGILVFPANTPQSERDAVLSEWKLKYQGPTNAGKLGVLTGDMEYQQIGAKPTDTGIEESRRFSKEEIFAIFGVPPTKVEISQARAEAEAGDYAYRKDTIKPRILRIQAVLNERLCPLYDERIFCCFDDPVPGDVRLRLDVVKTHLSTGMTTINEEREEDGLEAVDWGAEPILPGSYTPLSVNVERAKRPPPAPIAPGQPPPKPNEEAEPEKGKAICDCHAKAVSPMTAQESAFGLVMRQYFADQAEDVKSRLGEIAANG